MVDRRGFALAALLALTACGGDGQGPDDEGEPPVEGCTDGSSEGSLTRICFPADWNGDLILFAHGYVQPDLPLEIPEYFLAGAPLGDVITAQGYAYATTSYRANGLVADVAVEDVARLEELVRRTVRPDPDRVFMVGISEGGLVAALSAEREGDRYDGLLAACGPIGDFARQIDYFSDVRVVFDYLFPGVLPGSPIEPPEEVRAGWLSTYAPAVRFALIDDPVATAELAAVTGVPTEGLDAEGLAESVVSVLFYNVLGSADAQARLGGQPYDNQSQVYQGSADDAGLNAGVARFTADPDARAALGRFETTGEPSSPISILHTTRDQVVPFFHQQVYADKVAAAGRAELLRRFDVDRGDHCEFTASELLAAFGALLE